MKLVSARRRNRALADPKPRWLRAVAGFTATIAVMTVLAVGVLSLIDGRDMREGRSASLPQSAGRGVSAEKF